MYRGVDLRWYMEAVLVAFASLSYCMGVISSAAIFYQLDYQW